MSVSFLERAGMPALAYEYSAGDRVDLPVIVFLPGFRSDMQGTKAVFLADHARKKGQGMLRLDYSGHGQSAGRFEDGTIGQWFEDAMAVIKSVTATRRVLIVGSSMGGWIGLLAARALKERVAGYIGIAAAPDFTRDILARVTDAQKDDLAKQGLFKVHGEYSDDPLVITQRLLDDGENNCLLDGPIPVHCPVRLLQGRKDPDVPWEWALRIDTLLQSDDKRVIFREDGDHRLSTPEDLAILAGLVDDLSMSAE